MKPVGTIIIAATVCTAVGVGVVIWGKKKIQNLKEEESKERAQLDIPLGEWVGAKLFDSNNFERTYEYRCNTDPSAKRFSFKVKNTEIEFDTLEEGKSWVVALPLRNWQSCKPTPK